MLTDQTVIFFVPGIFFFIGIIFSCIAFGMGRARSKKKNLCTALTVGKVVDIRRVVSHDSDGSGSATWHPTFEYYVNGHTIIKNSSFGSTKSAFYIDQPVTIHYNPSNPDMYYVEEERVSLLLIRIFGGVGILLIVLAIAIPIVCFYLLRFVER